jgi:hypothetical protein
MRQNAFSRRPTINASRHLFHFDGVAESVLRNYDRFGAARRVPHIFTRKSRVQPKEILIASAKRLLQQNRPQADSSDAEYRIALSPSLPPV